MAASITIGHPSFSAFKPYFQPSKQTAENKTSYKTNTHLAARFEKTTEAVNMSITRRRQRTTFTSVQADTLEKEYLADQYMPRSRRMLIARSLGLNESQVKTWFQNRRAKDKRNDKNATLLGDRNSTTSSPSNSSPEVIENNTNLMRNMCPKTLHHMQLA